MKEIKITLPEGADKLNLSVEIDKDGNAVVTYEKPTVDVRDKEPFKDGDIVVRDEYFKMVAIYHSTNDTGGIITYACFCKTILVERLDTKTGSGWGYTKDYRPATEEEKKMLFDALEKKGYRWNAEEKKIEKLPRWRSLHDYYYVGSELEVCVAYDSANRYDCARYGICNYFKTSEAAERVAEQIREIFKNSKAE